MKTLILLSPSVKSWTRLSVRHHIQRHLLYQTYFHIFPLKHAAFNICHLAVVKDKHPVDTLLAEEAPWIFNELWFKDCEWNCCLQPAENKKTPGSIRANLWAAGDAPALQLVHYKKTKWETTEQIKSEQQRRSADERQDGNSSSSGRLRAWVGVRTSFRVQTDDVRETSDEESLLLSSGYWWMWNDLSVMIVSEEQHRSADSKRLSDHLWNYSTVWITTAETINQRKSISFLVWLKPHRWIQIFCFSSEWFKRLQCFWMFL